MSQRCNCSWRASRLSVRIWNLDESGESGIRGDTFNRAPLLKVDIRFKNKSMKSECTRTVLGHRYSTTEVAIRGFGVVFAIYP